MDQSNVRIGRCEWIFFVHRSIFYPFAAEGFNRTSSPVSSLKTKPRGARTFERFQGGSISVSDAESAVTYYPPEVFTRSRREACYCCSVPLRESILETAEGVEKGHPDPHSDVASE